MNVLLVSTYELGRQPLHVASPAAALLRAGHHVRALDLAVEDWDDEAVAWADAVGFSVYMHTSMRLALAAAQRIRDARPEVPLCLYGLYAAVSRDDTVGRAVDHVVAGEYEPGLVAWVDGLAGTVPVPEGSAVVHLGRSDFAVVHLGRSDFAVPARHILPPLERYARLEFGDETHLVGAVEASHGCNERCRHCPVPVVYDGRTRAVPVDLIMGDVRQLVDAGAGHITFGDPDFLSGPAHARRVVEAFAAAFPGVSFDVTTKVEHVLGHPDIVAELAGAGCLFVVSAVECVNDRILGLLRKGHTRSMAAEAVGLLRSHGIEPRSSFLAFTPWTSPADVLDILDFVAEHDLVPNVDPVQYTLRLLLPEGSLLLGIPEIEPFVEAYDPGALTHPWRADDPAADDLQRELARLVEDGTAAGRGTVDLYAAVRERVAEAAGKPGAAALPAGVRDAATRPRPRLTEPWFCCAEPTEVQLGVVTGP